MFILSLLPTFLLQIIVHGLVLIGLIVLVAGFFKHPYAKICSLAGGTLLIIGIYFEGGYSAEMNWRDKVAQYEQKVAQLEEQSKNVNTVVETKYVERVKVIKEKTDANIQFVEKVITQYDDKCQLSNAAISLHNSASQAEVPPGTGSAVEGTSEIKASDVFRTVAENYGICNEVREQVLGWQEWYKEQKRIYEETTK